MRVMLGELDLMAMAGVSCGHGRISHVPVPDMESMLCNACWEERLQDFQSNFGQNLRLELMKGVERGDRVAVRIPFHGPTSADGTAAAESMWLRVQSVDADNELLTGILWNVPRCLQGVHKGDVIKVSFAAFNALRIGDVRHFGECQVEKDSRASSIAVAP
jgi:hypothetical protein